MPEKPILQGFRRSVTSAKVHYIPDVSGYAAKLKIQWWRHHAGSTPASGTNTKILPVTRQDFCVHIFYLVSGEKKIMMF